VDAHTTTALERGATFLTGGLARAGPAHPAGPDSFAHAILSSAEDLEMHTCHSSGTRLIPATKRWSRARARIICPRRHLRVLPTRTRPSLFGGD